tara:strand:+ start:83 stop:280 length:198 start_codon:yes stop_codon:yes gene_type:complete
MSNQHFSLVFESHPKNKVALKDIRLMNIFLLLKPYSVSAVRYALRIAHLWPAATYALRTGQPCLF